MKEPYNALQCIKWLSSSDIPCVLMLSHAMGGGVARHLAELTESLQGRAYVLQLFPCSSSQRLIILALPGIEPECQEIRMGFSWPEQKDYFWRFLAQLGISQIHVHHVLNWPQGFWDDFIKRSMCYDLTLHDHCVFSCSYVQLPANDVEAGWLERARRGFSGDIGSAGDHLLQLARAARRVIVSSKALKTQLQLFLSEQSINLNYHPHPEVEQQQPYPAPWLRALADAEPLRILCLGMLSEEKGARVLAQVAREVQKLGMPLEFHLLGSCYISLPASVHRHGSYKDQEVPDLLGRLDPHVLWLPAQCPETWSYTLSAGLRAGLPVVATRIGVFPERLQKRPLSWLYDVDLTISQWLGVFEKVRSLHVPREGQPVVWRYKNTKPFYTEQGEYLFGDGQALPCKIEALSDVQVNQLLVQGLPRAGHWRANLLHVLLRLKYSAALAPLVSIVPYAWQRRIKRLISRAPLHEPPR